MAQRPVIEFWYDFASTYSYLRAMRIEERGGGGRSRRALAAVPPRTGLRRPRLDHLAFQPVSRQGSLHVARHGARGRTARAAVLPPQPVSAEQPARRARGARRFGARLGARLHAARLSAEEFGNGRDIGEPRRSWPTSCPDLGLDAQAILDGGADRRPTRCGCGGSARRPTRAASSARRPSSPRTARCSGATTGWNRRSNGRARQIACRRS